MIFNLKQNLSALAIFIGAVAFIGCGSTSSKTAEPANAKPSTTVETKTTETANKTTAVTKDGEPPTTIHDNSTKLTAFGDDKVGVAECDDFIEKYEACLINKVPEAARPAMLSSVDQMRKSWKSAAASPQAKSGLAAACKQAHETAKQSMSSYSCAW